MHSPGFPAASRAAPASLIKKHPVAAFLVLAVLFGALLGNIWEELAWTGVVQHRLMDPHGMVVAALLTAIPFALIHLPFAFAEKGLTATPWAEVAVSWAVLFLFAPFFRALIGLVYVGTAYSLLIVGLLHASFNASAATKLNVFDGDWQQIAALIVLLAAVMSLKSIRSKRPAGQDRPERTLEDPAERLRNRRPEEA
ncbi:CPBP family intramembrane glutamic endopeptidase [Arthrobacter sp. NPDC093139]|uniref:CPBP family intramembrane glutamic endopeptidase n=1 Tax=Arthrobacter sp. NPDC093139 TaxID=3363945 RepID=UPI00381ABD77